MSIDSSEEFPTRSRGELVSSMLDIPEAGMAVLVRGRPAAVREVRRYESDGPAVHLVDVEYLDDSEFPGEDSVLWEREIDAKVLRGGGLPRVADGLAPDDPERFAAFCDAVRWSSVARLPGLTGDEVPLVSPWESAVMPEPYQLYPVLKALEMPRVSLLLADDVGLGKTIEAGLIARELLDRGEIERLTVICPPHLCEQWQAELASKFLIDTEVVRTGTAGRLERGLPAGQVLFDVYPFTVVSLDYIKSERRRDDFIRACPELVIVEEAHTCVGGTGTSRHLRYRLLRDLANTPHRHMLLLTATPHSGDEEAFHNLLGLLDTRFAALQGLLEH
jgi:hypothetical protein